jgi:hypothetical protein
MAIKDRLVHAWNAFKYEERRRDGTDAYAMGAAFGARPDVTRLRRANERSIIASIYNRLGIDVASHDIRHVRLDDEGRYLEDMTSGLNECLTLRANIDQAARAFRQDIAMTLFDRGVLAIVPVDTTFDPTVTGSYDIKTMRIAEIMSWYPEKVRVSLWNQKLGMKQELTLPKSMLAIIENPLYSVMNEPNSTLQRLIRTLNNLDAVDAQSASGKLDIIIQLPYAIKSEARRDQAEKRRKDIEFQLKGSQYGIAYSDATEKIVQLNRAAENNLLKQVEYLTNLLYSQLGLTDEIMAGTADEKAMLNYENRTVEPILAAIAEAMRWSFLTKTARSQGQSIKYFTDPFRLVPLSAIAEIADKFTRNEILSSNEIRQIIGTKPSKDPKADELHNSNMPRVDTAGPPPPASNGNDGTAEHSFRDFRPALTGAEPANGHSRN